MAYRIVIPLLFVVWLAGPLAAQDASDTLADIRGQNSINDENLGKIRNFVGENIAAIVANDPLASQEAFARLRGAYNGSAAFKAAYANACINAVTSAYRKANVVAAARLVTLVNSFDALDALPLLLQALQDDRVGVRAAAAIGLDRLRTALAAAGAGPFGQAIDALATAAKRERSTVTLQAIYAAMDYSGVQNVPDARRAAAALLGVLEERAKQYTGDGPSAAGADDAGLRVIGSYAGTLNDDERKRLTVAVAKMMKYAIERYTSGRKKLADVRDEQANPQLIEQRNGVERLIEIGQDALKTLLKPSGLAPNVVTPMRKLDLIGMKNEWKKWNDLLQAAVGQSFALTIPDESETPDAESNGP